ncbi:sulfurtransferase complex subunit TusB [Thalassotalea profundi]|uniref:Sulfurtransferase complex subunit TusB n=1 Tax=Thalassotalea profundi TaxID=2036687 RepID=A0ABQ3IIW6_9GAMM|nr:sulfurtransferase complex subunit TusB [Thalassotalea profundi]GHE83179.1 hypothetical protein GCM10011501_09460 [Thalassotalea profundi]
MTTLHLIRDSALSNNSINLCLTNLSATDVIVLIDDGCYNINSAFISDAQKIIPLKQCYAIEEHINARGLQVNTAIVINYEYLLELIFNHQNVITWQ